MSSRYGNLCLSGTAEIPLAGEKRCLNQIEMVVCSVVSLSLVLRMVHEQSITLERSSKKVHVHKQHTNYFKCCSAFAMVKKLKRYLQLQVLLVII